MHICHNLINGSQVLYQPVFHVASLLAKWEYFILTGIPAEVRSAGDAPKCTPVPLLSVTAPAHPPRCHTRLGAAESVTAPGVWARIRPRGGAGVAGWGWSPHGPMAPFPAAQSAGSQGSGTSRGRAGVGAAIGSGRSADRQPPPNYFLLLRR